ncbi:RCC1 domain-containing protein [Myxococcus sp. AM011]|uniref:RCC1 domain-containing protein n=1 Tax=Myxococcus sp. AM011 TaxID=2745200 RepID=UPI0020CF9E6E|nr:RCC1 domain-containing protein [Myxococcus sp. AM011]
MGRPVRPGAAPGRAPPVSVKVDVACGGSADAIHLLHGRVEVRRGAGTVGVWGDNAHGQLGTGSLQNQRAPVRAWGLWNINAIGAGDLHSRWQSPGAAASR